MGKKWTAILISSLLFGITHGILQQSISAFLVGIIIGYIAVQSGSVLPCILFHLSSNSLTVLMSRLTSELVVANPVLNRLFQVSSDGLGYSFMLTILSPFLSLMILLWFRSLPYEQYAEERLRKALDVVRPEASVLANRRTLV